MKAPLVYLDHAATSPSPDEVLDTFRDLLKRYPWNTQTKTQWGVESAATLLQYRKNFSQVFQCQEADLLFTSGGSESNNLAVHALSRQIKSGVVWRSRTLHPSLARALDALDLEQWQIVDLPITAAGSVDLSSIENLPQPQLVAIEWVNSEIGFVQPLEKISAYLQSKHPDARLIVDGVQGLGKIDLPSLTGVSAFSFSGHKMGAPVGVGGLMLRGTTQVHPMIHGGGQEKGWRAGTVALPLIGSMWNAFERLNKLEGCDLAKVLTECDAPTAIRDPKGDYSPYVVTLNTDPVEGEVLLHHLEQEGIAVGLGSACSSAKKQLSPVHRALGLNEKQSRCTLRLSSSPRQARDELHQALRLIGQKWQEVKRFF